MKDTIFVPPLKIQGIKTKLVPIIKQNINVTTNIFINENEINFCFDLVQSKNLSKNLCGCKKAYIMCATLGIEVDRIIKK